MTQKKWYLILEISTKVAIIVMIAIKHWIHPKVVNWGLPRKFIAKIAIAPILECQDMVMVQL